MTLAAVIAKLYESEINCGTQSFWDGGIEVWIGDDLNGRHERRTFRVKEIDSAATWLAEAAVRAYPESAFAKENS